MSKPMDNFLEEYNLPGIGIVSISQVFDTQDYLGWINGHGPVLYGLNPSNLNEVRDYVAKVACHIAKEKYNDERSKPVSKLIKRLEKGEKGMRKYKIK